MDEAVVAYLPTDHHSMIYRDKHNWYHLYAASGVNLPITRCFPLLQLELRSNIARLQPRNIALKSRDQIFPHAVHYCIGRNHNYIFY